MSDLPDSVRVSTFVKIDPKAAFDVFTKETDLWWKRGPAYRFSHRDDGVIKFEGANGRLVEAFDDGTERVIGEVLAWEPGHRLVFSFRARNFKDHERTEVEVSFAAKRGGTEIVVEHRGWSKIPEHHPVRHGKPGLGLIAHFWAGLVVALNDRAAARGVAP